MDENTKEISLIAIIKYLLKKKKIIICIALLAAVLGGAFGVLKAEPVGYGAQVQFSIALISLNQNTMFRLQSESFAEQLLLDKNGLPTPEDPNNPSEDYKKAAEAKQAYTEILKRRDELSKELVEVSLRLSDAQAARDTASTEYNHAVNIYTSHLEMQSPISNYEQTLKELAADVATKEQTYNTALATYNEIKKEDSALNAENALLNQQVLELEEAKNVTATVVLEKWRANEQVQRDIEKVMNALTFTYPAADNEKTDFKNTMLFIDVLFEDEELANRVVARLIEYMPEFVGDTDGIMVGRECVLLSKINKVNEINKWSWTTSAVKYGVILCVVGAAGMCVLFACIYVLRMSFSEENASSKGNIDGDNGNDNSESPKE